MADQSATTDKKSGGSHGRLTLYIVIAIVLAIAISILVPTIGMAGLKEGMPGFDARKASLGNFFGVLNFGGEIFLRVLKMMVVPLVVLSVMSGILGMGDVRKLGKPGLVTICFYLGTTILAVLLGLLMVNLVKPGEAKIDQQQAAKIIADKADEMEEKGKVVKEEGVMAIVRNLGLMLFTDNLFNSAAKTDLLPLIVFSIVFAGMLTTLGERVDTITRIIDQSNHAMMALVLLVMKTAPLGIFCLVAGRFGEAMLDDQFLTTMQLVGWYSLTVVAALAIHSLVTLPAILYIFTRRNPYRFIGQMSQALLTAFSTASSSATLPVTMECATDKGKLSRKSVDFVLPLGATINMDGTALYEAVAAIFIAQYLIATGVAGAPEMTFANQAIIAVTATLAAIGAAGIPEAGLFTMLVVLNAVGLPVQYQALIIPVDWLLDRFRTTVNVFGDACGAAVVDQTFPPDTLAAHASLSEDPTP